ncbi:MAG: hypothetical protein AAGD07_23735 [Planctomycetota bacterium]
MRFQEWIKRRNVTFDNYELARIIKSLTHDESLAVGQEVQALLELDRFKDDDYMVEACLTCLASRSHFGGYLAERLEIQDFATLRTYDLPEAHLAAIATSTSAEVAKRLADIAKFSNDPDLFLVAAKATTETNWMPVLTRAKQILNDLPQDTKDGRRLLELIVEKSAGEAEPVLRDFLKPNTPSRCNTVCEVLWYGNPLSQRVLLHLLDDERPIPGCSVNVRDRAASAISHSIESIRFDSDWSKSRREEAVEGRSKGTRTLYEASSKVLRWPTPAFGFQLSTKETPAAESSTTGVSVLG